MNPYVQRLADAGAAIRRHRAIDAVSSVLRRSGRAIAGLVPPAVVTRWRALRARHPLLGHPGVGLAVVLAVAVLWFGLAEMREKGPGAVVLPDFASIDGNAERKRAFLDFLQPIVAYENERVLERRWRLLRILTRLEYGDELAAYEREWLIEQAERHRVDAEDDLAVARRLKAKIDMVPVSLALAQAALESAWGTSRFAREGNNLFGQWCFDPGCGIVPKRRPEHASYEVQAFDTVAEAVRTYLRNINSHPAYAPARSIRAQARSEGRRPTGMEMAAGLTKYAAIGEKYVEHIRGVIRRNELHTLALAD